ncbi:MULTISPECIES: DUF1045 domain-containing protein [unclassified Yoonia]|uniref:DUF1045 domain-containing protein n=1 Tax=unclassified Yoonia TaxID=2629118 RepID=UPI002AFFB787|nr:MULTISPECIES: DUF1045 domain-containing protein [unclassified Yoonia]
MFERFAIFYTPTGALADFGAAWLGWDNASGRFVPHPDVPGVDVATVTATPRKYGIHGTLKAPFRLSADTGPVKLQQAVADFAKRHAAVAIGHLQLAHHHGFVALRPAGDPPALRDLASAIVTELDEHRAPLTDADVARRRQAPLTLRQDRQMLDWGYPYIFDDFHFHLTLSGSLPEAEGARVVATLQPMLDPIIAEPWLIDGVTLMGQDAAGMFHQIHRYALTG